MVGGRGYEMEKSGRGNRVANPLGCLSKLVIVTIIEVVGIIVIKKPYATTTERVPRRHGKANKSPSRAVQEDIASSDGVMNCNDKES